LKKILLFFILTSKLFAQDLSHYTRIPITTDDFSQNIVKTGFFGFGETEINQYFIRIQANDFFKFYSPSDGMVTYVKNNPVISADIYKVIIEHDSVSSEYILQNPEVFEGDIVHRNQIIGESRVIGNGISFFGSYAVSYENNYVFPECLSIYPLELEKSIELTNQIVNYSREQKPVPDFKIVLPNLTIDLLTSQSDLDGSSLFHMMSLKTVYINIIMLFTRIEILKLYS